MHGPLSFPYSYQRRLLLPLTFSNGNLLVYSIHILYSDIITSVSPSSETNNDCDFSQIRSRVWRQRQCQKIEIGA